MLKKLSELSFSDIYYGAIFFMLIFPFMPIVLNNYFVLVPGVIALSAPFFAPRLKFCNPSLKALLISISFIILLISLSYSVNKPVALNELMKRLVLVIYPVIFFLRKTPLLVKHREQYEYGFIAIILIYFTWINVEIFYTFNKVIQEGHLVNSWYSAIINPYFQLYYRNLFSDLTLIHPTYASLYTFFASGVLLINTLNKEYIQSRKKQLLVLLVVVVLIVYSFFLAAKGPLLAFVIALIVVLFLRLSKKYFIVLGSGLVLFFAISILLFPPLRARVLELVKPAQKTELSSVSVRKIIHSTSWGLIKNNCLIGVGIGDVQDKLNEGYEVYQMKEISDFTLNTHNEYFNLWASAGVFGVLSILLTLIIPLVKSVRQKDYIFLFFIILMGISFLFENILSRQKGILFFAFFYAIYLFNQIDRSKCQQDIQNI